MSTHLQIVLCELSNSCHEVVSCYTKKWLPGMRLSLVWRGLFFYTGRFKMPEFVCIRANQTFPSLLFVTSIIRPSVQELGIVEFMMALNWLHQSLPHSTHMWSTWRVETKIQLWIKLDWQLSRHHNFFGHHLLKFAAGAFNICTIIAVYFHSLATLIPKFTEM